MQRPQRGFTLIELLVVIAIIGILSSVILASLNSARLKGRDSRRLSELHQMATAAAFTGCTSAGVRVSTCTSPDLSEYKDPSGSTTACTTGSTGTCDYAIGKNTLATASPNSENFEVCAYLEVGGGPRSTPGMVSLNSSGSVVSGCN